MLKQALSKSPIPQEAASPPEIFEQQQKEVDEPLKTSLLTQIINSSQRSSNKRQSLPTNGTAQIPSHPQEPLFLDEVVQATNKNKKRYTQAQTPPFPRFMQIKSTMEVNISENHKTQKKVRKNIVNCTGQCLIY